MNVKEIMDTPLTENQSVMAVMSEDGDYKVIWDRSVPDEVRAARTQFTQWRERGYMAYKVEGADARKGEVLHEFDPAAQSIIFAPPMRGGCR